MAPSNGGAPPGDPFVLNAFISAKLDVEFPLVNGTTKVSISFVDSGRPRDPDVAAIVFLCLLLAASLLTNLCVVATISISSRLRESAVYNLLAQLSGTCLLDAALNLAVSISYASLVHWTLPGALCSCNSFFMLFVSAATCNAVVCLVIERFYLARNPVRHIDRMRTVISYSRISWLLSWIMLAALYAPTAIDQIVEAVAFPDRYSCGPNGNYQRLYMVILLVVSHILPLAVIMGCLLLMAKMYCAQRQTEKRRHKAGADRDSPSMNAVALMSEESRNTSLVLVLTAAYVLLLLPHVLSVHQFQVSHVPVRRNTTPFQDFLDKLSVGKTAEQVQALKLSIKELRHWYNETHEGVVDSVPLVKEVEEGTFQTGLVWCRYLFDALVPILILGLQGDVRAKSLSFYRHFVADRVTSIMEDFRQWKTRSRRGLAIESSRSSTGSSGSYSRSIPEGTPVLFTTDQGLVLRVLKIKGTAFASPIFRYVSCDIPPEDRPVDLVKNKKNISLLGDRYPVELTSPIIAERRLKMTTAFSLDVADNAAERPFPLKPSKVSQNKPSDGGKSKRKSLPRPPSLAKRPRSRGIKKRSVRFKSAVKEIAVPNKNALDNNFLVEQLKNYFASRGVVLVCEPAGNASSTPKSPGPWSPARAVIRDKILVRGSNYRKGQEVTAKSNVRKISTRMANKIRPPWKI